MNESKGQINSDICRNHSARLGAERDIFRICPSKLNKRELEDLYFGLLSQNLELKQNVNEQKEKIKTLSTKLLRVTNAQRNSLLKEQRDCCATSKAVINEHLETIAELQNTNDRLAERLKQMNMKLCSARQFLKPAGRCSKCYSSVRNKSTSALNAKGSDGNIRTTASSQYLYRDIVSTRSMGTEIDHEALGFNEKLCSENKCRSQMENLNTKVMDLQEELSKSHKEYSQRISHLESEVAKLQSENIEARARQKTSEQCVQQRENEARELTQKLRDIQSLTNDLELQLSLEKKKSAELQTLLKATQLSTDVAKTIEDHLSNTSRNQEYNYKINSEFLEDIPTRSIQNESLDTTPKKESPYQDRSPTIKASTPVQTTYQSDFSDSGYTDLNKSHVCDAEKVNQELLNQIKALEDELQEMKMETIYRRNTDSDVRESIYVEPNLTELANRRRSHIPVKQPSDKITGDAVDRTSSVDNTIQKEINPKNKSRKDSKDEADVESYTNQFTADQNNSNSPFNVKSDENYFSSTAIETCITKEPNTQDALANNKNHSVVEMKENSSEFEHLKRENGYIELPVPQEVDSTGSIFKNKDTFKILNSNGTKRNDISMHENKTTLKFTPTQNVEDRKCFNCDGQNPGKLSRKQSGVTGVKDSNVDTGNYQNSDFYKEGCDFPDNEAAKSGINYVRDRDDTNESICKTFHCNKDKCEINDEQTGNKSNFCSNKVKESKLVNNSKKYSTVETNTQNVVKCPNKSNNGKEPEIDTNKLSKKKNRSSLQNIDQNRVNFVKNENNTSTNNDKRKHTSSKYCNTELGVNRAVASELKEAEENCQTYTINGKRGCSPRQHQVPASPDSTDCEISHLTDLPSEREEATASSSQRASRSLSPGERYSRSYTASYLTTDTSLSEGEVFCHSERKLTFGECGVNVNTVRSTESTKQKMESALQAITTELTRCRQLLRLTSDRQSSVSG